MSAAVAVAPAAALAAGSASLGAYVLQTVPFSRGNQLVTRAVRADCPHRQFDVAICNKSAEADAKHPPHSPPPSRKAYYENELWVHEKLPPHPSVMIALEAFEDDSNTYVVYDACDVQTDLLKYISRHGRLGEHAARELFTQLALAVLHCHRHNVVHRDIKLPAILLDLVQKRAYLAGFGYAEVLQNPKQLLSDRRGSPAYVSPEMLQSRAYCGQAADVWSLGVVLYVMLCGTYPFVDRDPKALFEKIVSSKIALPGDLSPEAVHLLTRILSRDPRARATIADILNDPWLRGSPSGEPEQLVPSSC